MIEPRQLFNFIQGSDITGESSYDVWKRLGNEGSEADFLEFIRSGPKGENGYFYALSASELVMKKGVNNALLPANITFKGYYRIGVEPTRYDYAGRFVVQETSDGDTWYTKYTSSLDEVSIVYTPSSSNVKVIRCTLYSSGGTITEIDTQTVVILEDVSSIEVGARNLLSNSDVHYEITKNSSSTSYDIPVVSDFDLQRFIDKTVTLSYYVDTLGSYTGSGMFGVSSTVVWSDSTGVKTEFVTNPFVMNSINISKQRVSSTVTITTPNGYDTIESFNINIILSLKPSTDNIWVFERPKLEIGNIPTEWIMAPEDIKTIVNEDLSDLTAHIEDEDNPHGVTKTQIGLGNVPNVTTNNQTPTYTTASSLSSLTSGEKLSTAFGKIAKAIFDFISHLADKSNPHEVTASQVSAAPTSHASSATTYGVGTSSSYGHLKLSDSTESSNSVSNGIAATPKAINLVARKSNASYTASGSASSLSLSAGTATKINLNKMVYIGPGHNKSGTEYNFELTSDGGIRCPISGTVIVSGGVYINGTSGTEMNKRCYIKLLQDVSGASEETICYQSIRDMGATGGIFAGTKVITVQDGDTFYLYAQCSSATTCTPNSESTYLSIAYISTN